MSDLKVNKQNGNLSSVSTLSVSHKQTYDYIYTSNEEMEIKTEPTFIKQETDISDCEMDDVKTDIDIDETINFEFVNTEVKETIQSDDGNVIVSKQETLDDNEISNLDGENDEQTKFSKVIFTEEEMQECREMKRSQSNFQALQLQCCDCIIGFKRKYKYDLHMEKKHYLKAGSFLCDICKIRFPSDVELAQHRNKHYDGYKCKLCHYKSTLCRTMRAHCSAHNKVDTVKKIRCRYCKVILETVEKLTEHIGEKHKFSCDICPVTLAGKRALRRHKRQIHKWKMEFICDICARTFMHKARLESHMVTHDDNIVKKLSYCAVCNIQYKSKNTYKDHLRKSVTHMKKLQIHAEKMEFICDICARTFTHKAQLESHMVTHDDNIVKQMSYCAVCNIQYKNVNTYRDHLRKSVTHLNKLFKCSDCGEEFATLAYWQQHRNICHLQKDRSKCELCNEVFKSKRHLTKHNIVRHGLVRTRDHHCGECGKSFLNKYLLNVHMNSHTGKRPYVCATCGASFTYSGALYTHETKYKGCRALRERQTATAETNSADGSNVGHTVNLSTSVSRSLLLPQFADNLK